MRTYVITLDDGDLGQILDGLELRAESWERTRNYLQTGLVDLMAPFIIEECSKAQEAEAISTHYRLIIAKILDQMKTQ